MAARVLGLGAFLRCTSHTTFTKQNMYVVYTNKVLGAGGSSTYDADAETHLLAGQSV